MSRADESRFLDALLGADPDEPSSASAQGQGRDGASDGPTGGGTATPRRTEGEAATTGSSVATLRRPGRDQRRSYEPVLPVPDDPEVVEQLKARAGVAEEEPRLAGFLEGLLGFVGPEPEVDVRHRLIESYGKDAGTEAGGEPAGETETEPVQDGEPATADGQGAVPTVPAEPVPLSPIEPTETPQAEPAPSGSGEDGEKTTLPPLSHDVAAPEVAPGPRAETPDEAGAPLGEAPAAAAADTTPADTTPADTTPADTTPSAAEQPAAVASAPPSPPDEVAELVRSLTSFDVGRRRGALLALLDRPLDRELAAAAASSLRDPESAIRLLALQVLERAPELAPVEALDLAMLDPEAEIRRRAAALVGRTGDLGLLPHLQSRLEDETDEDVLAAGLTAVADLFRIAGERADEVALDRVSATVGHLRTTALPQLGRELAVLARTLDEGEVRHRLGDVDAAVRIGAAVLALESRSDDSLRALARLVTDESGRVRQLAMAAVARLRSEDVDTAFGPEPRVREPEHEAASGDHEGGMSRAVADEVQGALLPGLLEALADPKQEIRDQARSALELVDRDRLLGHVRNEAQRADGEGLVRLITAARQLSLREAVPALASGAVSHPTERVAEALRELPGVTELLTSWGTSDDPEARGDAVRLAALMGADQPSALLAGLNDPNPTVRLIAIETAHGRIDDRLAGTLLKLIEGDPSARVQVAALEAFREAPASERRAAARAASGSAVAAVRRHGLTLLSPDAGDDFNQLAAALRDADLAVVEAAARALTASGTPAATALLWSEIRGADTERRQRMLEVLHAEQAEVLSRLARRAVESADPSERAAGLSALAMTGSSAVRDQVVDALGDPSVEVRLEALRALAADPGAVGTGALGAVMHDADAQVRAHAVDVIAGTEDEDALPLLIRALDDPAEGVRLATRSALGRLRSPAAVDLLLEALERPAHRAAAVEALAALGESATGRLVRAFAASGGEVREAVRTALLRSGAIDRTVASLRDPKPARRRAALTLLRAVRPEGIAAEVAQRLEDPDPDVRQAAAQLLGELGDRSVVQVLQHAFVNDPDMDVVAAVETAYRRLGGGEGR